MFEDKEANTRLEAIAEMCENEMKTTDMLVSTAACLRAIRGVAVGEDDYLDEDQSPPLQEKEERVIISCDASVKNNPGGPSAVGVVIVMPNGKRLSISKQARATTCNQAEYEAIYFGLISLMNLNNNPGVLLEVRSDSKLVVYQLNGDQECHDEKLQAKRDHIREFIAGLPVPVKFVWRPRNSTPELREANFLAQDELGVRRH